MKPESTLRNELVKIGRRMHARRLISGSDGNLSCRLGKKRILITPAGVNKGFLDADDICLVDPDGSPLRSGRRPSSELKMHLAIYAQAASVQAIVHGHPPFITSFAIAGRKPSPDLLPEGVILLKNATWIGYSTPSTAELANRVAHCVPSHSLIIMANHGATAVGGSLEEAYNQLEALEYLAEIAFLTNLLGKPHKLPAREVKKLMRLFGAG